jgi:hypothetical protein
MKKGLPPRLPVLDNVRVASPCEEPWETMTGDDRVRHCGRCDLDVFNLSSMTKDDAESFVGGRLGLDRTCIRYFERRDGTILTQDCPAGWRRVQRRLFLVTAGVFSFLTLGAIAAFAGTRAVTCHTSSATDPFESGFVQTLIALFSGQPIAPPQAPTAGIMVYVPPPATPVPPVPPPYVP